MSEQIEVEPIQRYHRENTSRALHVVAFADLCRHTSQASIITLQGARLMQGERSVPRPIERDANDIARTNDIITKAFARLSLADSEIAPHSMGFSVRSLTAIDQLEIADFTNGKYPINHEYDLELHEYDDLLEKLEGDEERHTDLAYLRSFGDYAFKNL
jgi:hypothetical protein